MNRPARWESENEELSISPFFSVKQLQVTDRCSGRKYVRHIVEHPGGAGIVAVVEGQVLCIEQYRPAIREVTIEIPAGRREVGESAAENAARELFEETGYIAGELKHLGRFHAVPCFSNWVANLYLATDVRWSLKVELAEDLPSRAVFIDIDDIEALILSGRLTDGKSIIGMLLARAVLHGQSR